MICNKITFLLSTLFLLCACSQSACSQKKDDFPKKGETPNFIIVFIDDLNFDALGSRPNPNILTPNLDSLSKKGINFKNAFVTLSVCSPSRAAILTGRYGSANGVTKLADAGYGGLRGSGTGNVSLNKGEKTFANYLKENGYETALIGKWHLRVSPDSTGFDYKRYFSSNGPWYNRKVFENGEGKIAKGFIEDYNVEQAKSFLESRQKDKPFVVFYNTQLPHLNPDFGWIPREKTLRKYQDVNIEPPKNWKDDLSGKPPYLKNGRARKKALENHYDNRDTLVKKIKRYYATVTELDATLGRLFRYLHHEGLDENTYIFVMGDNGFFIGDHMFYSKVLPYEKSIRMPFIVAGPGIEPGNNEQIVLNIDIFPTLMELANIKIPNNIHGKSLVPLLENKKEVKWRDLFLYQAPESVLGSWPLYAVRTRQYKYIRTYNKRDPNKVAYEELYDLESDPYELTNLIDKERYTSIIEGLSKDLDSLREEFKK